MNIFLLTDSFLWMNCLFLFSTLSAYTMCFLYKTPFYHEKDKHNFSKIKTIALNGTFALLESTYVTNYFLTNKIITYHHNHFYQTIYNLFLYTFYVEFLYYFLHRMYHTKYFYIIIHKTHHETHDVYPIDALHFSFVDIQTMFFTLGAPVCFLRMSFLEYFLSLYLYLTFSFISHSNLFYNHHIIHHKLMKYNYCLLIPYLDILLKTFKE